MMNIADKLIFYHLKKRGVEIIYWALNKPEEFERAIKSGVDGIITDCPTLLINSIQIPSDPEKVTLLIDST